MKQSQADQNAYTTSSSTISGTSFIKKIHPFSKSQITKFYIDRRKSSIQKPLLIHTKSSQKLIQNNKQPSLSSKSSLKEGFSQSKSLAKDEKDDTKVDEQNIRSSTFLQGESTRTFQLLRKENEKKEMKIRDLTNLCQKLVQKLKNHLSSSDLQAQLQDLETLKTGKTQQLFNLCKIRNEELFFKIKLQVVALLQQFQVQKEQINGVNEAKNQSELFTFMARKLKLKLKDFRLKEQESSFQLKKDKIMEQKQQERINYLIQTNQLLKLSQIKLKTKVDDLRKNLSQFVDKIKEIQIKLQQKDNEIFKLQKQNEEQNTLNNKLSEALRRSENDKSDQKRAYQAKQKEMKALLSSYYMEKKRLENQLQEKEGQMQEILIKEQFLYQENEKYHRECVRWKERYENLEKEKLNSNQEFNEERFQLFHQFQHYKAETSESLSKYKEEIDDALKKVEDYKHMYEVSEGQIKEQKRLNQAQKEQFERYREGLEKEWVEKIKEIQKIREMEILQITKDNENREKQIIKDFQKREQLLKEEMEVRKNAFLSQNIRDLTRKQLQLETQNENLRIQVKKIS